MRIERVTAEAIRGIAHGRTIILDGKSLVLFGDNGTGKSSFVEAIECALTGNIKSLSTKGQRVSFKKHSTHINFKEKDRKALVTFKTKDKSLGPMCAPFTDSDLTPEAQSYLSVAINGSFILRRSALLLFVEATDKDRYNIVKPFLGLERYEEFEGGLKEAKSQLLAEYNSVKTKLNSTKTILGKKFELSLDQVLDVNLKRCLQQDCESFFKKPIDNIDTVKELRLASQGKISKSGQEATAARTQIVDFLAMIPSKEILLKFEEALELRFEEEVSNATKFFEKVLSLGLDWIVSDNLDECPLCEQSIDRDAVLAAIRARIEKNKQLAKAREDCDLLKTTVLTNCEQLIQKSSVLETAWQKATGNNEVPTKNLIDYFKDLKSLINKTDYWNEKLHLSELLENIRKKNLEEIQQQAESELGWSEQTNDESYFKVIDRCNSYIEFVPTIQQLVTEYKSAEKLMELSSKLHERAVAIRKEECARIFNDIGSDIKKIYDSFHPDEPLGEFTLEVKERGEGSAVLLGGFGDRTEEDPRAYYSEAHQDTLGLAIFLSLYQRVIAGTEFNLLVLDDILTSVDADHRRRVAEYLLEQVRQGTQIIITTHSRIWFEWLLQIQSNKGLRENFVNKRIVDWSLEDGPVLEDPEGDFDYLKAETGRRPHEQLLPVAGRLLEEILHYMRFGLSLAIAAKPSEQYTIGDIFPTFHKKLSSFPGLSEEIKDICTELVNTWGVRNWSTHYNEWAKELSAGEAKQFISPVMKLYEKTFCSSCKSFIIKSDTERGATRCKKGCLVYKGKAAIRKV